MRGSKTPLLGARDLVFPEPLGDLELVEQLLQRAFFVDEPLAKLNVCPHSAHLISLDPIEPDFLFLVIVIT
jgi:hypothetical protein